MSCFIYTGLCHDTRHLYVYLFSPFQKDYWKNYVFFPTTKAVWRLMEPVLTSNKRKQFWSLFLAHFYLSLSVFSLSDVHCPLSVIHIFKWHPLWSFQPNFISSHSWPGSKVCSNMLKTFSSRNGLTWNIFFQSLLLSGLHFEKMTSSQWPQTTRIMILRNTIQYFMATCTIEWQQTCQHYRMSMCPGLIPQLLVMHSQINHQKVPQPHLLHCLTRRLVSLINSTKLEV